MGIPKHNYLMDYISDRTVYNAVMFARRMIREGQKPSHATRIAANYYKADIKEVRHYVSQVAARVKQEREES